MDKAIDNYFTKIINDNHTRAIQEEIINSKNKKLSKVQNVFAMIIGLMFITLPITMFISYVTYSEEVVGLISITILVISAIMIKILENKKRK